VRTEALFADRLFAPPTERISGDDVFALSAEMQRFLEADIGGQLARKGAREALIDAIYSRGQLRIEYDSVLTRNAAQAFAARAGNCLSLVVMTAAFARALELPVQFQSVSVDEAVSRNRDLQFYIGHVNLTLGTRDPALGLKPRSVPDLMTVDFLPPQQTAGLRTRPIGEHTIVAMYMNNRAAEALAHERVDDAYWWARAAIAQDPTFLSTYNTLGVVYRRHGHPADAERVLAYALARDPKNTHVMSNLIRALDDLGRTADARELTRRMHELDPDPPFSHFKPGLQAMRDGNFRVARDLFAKEVDRSPYYHEFRFWLANAYAGLGDMERARREMALALEYSTSRRDQDLYAAKLDRIRSTRLQ
jgi:tetratricopeptide (TPR) repeat protein